VCVWHTFLSRNFSNTAIHQRTCWTSCGSLFGQSKRQNSQQWLL